jgi:hypothetical protein
MASLDNFPKPRNIDDSDSDEDRERKNKKDDFIKLLRGRFESADDIDYSVSFLPTTVRSPVLQMRAVPYEYKDIFTVFMGTIRPSYTKERWEKDLTHWREIMKCQSFVDIEIMPMMSEGKMRDATDSLDAIPKIEKAIEKLNQLEDKAPIRLVCLGNGFSNFIYDAITFLLREWKNSDGSTRTEKHLEFVTCGDTRNTDLCNYCRWLTVSKVCTAVDFYNTMEYHPFGFIAPNYPSNERKNKGHQ